MDMAMCISICGVATSIQEMERTTNHDVKVVEYFLKEKVSLILELKQVRLPGTHTKR
jgi:hypothetical protein